MALSVLAAASKPGMGTLAALPALSWLSPHPHAGPFLYLPARLPRFQLTKSFFLCNHGTGNFPFSNEKQLRLSCVFLMQGGSKQTPGVPRASLAMHSAVL